MKRSQNNIRKSHQNRNQVAADDESPNRKPKDLEKHRPKNEAATLVTVVSKGTECDEIALVKRQH